MVWIQQTWNGGTEKLHTENDTFFFVPVIRLDFYPVDMPSKYNMVNTGRLKYSWSNKWEERLLGLRGLERAPSLAGVEHRTSGPHWRAQKMIHYQA